MKQIKNFESFLEKGFKSRKEEQDHKSIDYMLNNAIMFQEIKLRKEKEKLEAEKLALETERDNDSYVKADPNTDTNPVLVEYVAKISEIDAKIAEIDTKMQALKQ